MTTLYITEYQHLDTEAKGRDVMIGRMPPVAEQTVDYSGGVMSSAAFAGKTRFVRVWALTDCHVAFGDTPTATTSTTPLTSRVAEYFGVNGGDVVSVLSQS